MTAFGTTVGIRAGLASAIFRDLSVDDVIRQAVRAGFESIEWRTDVHVRSGDPEAARRVGEQTRDAGLEVASLASDYRCTPNEDIEPLLVAAEELGAPRIRVWAGRSGSATASPAERSTTTTILHRSARRARDQGVELALEFHGGTLADTGESARLLLSETASDNVRAYWQPTLGLPDDEAFAELLAVSPWVSAIRVFSWWARSDRLALETRPALWSRALAYARSLPHVTDAFLEFIQIDDPSVLPREAALLRQRLA